MTLMNHLHVYRRGRTLLDLIANFLAYGVEIDSLGHGAIYLLHFTTSLSGLSPYAYLWINI
jgi:hypothetical protein